MCSWFWVFDVFRTFVLFTHGGFTALSTSTAAVYVFCCTFVLHGWVDRFVGVTVVLRSAVLLKVGG